jgi:hypothetical protein
MFPLTLPSVARLFRCSSPEPVALRAHLEVGLPFREVVFSNESGRAEVRL